MDGFRKGFLLGIGPTTNTISLNAGFPQQTSNEFAMDLRWGEWRAMYGVMITTSGDVVCPRQSDKRP